MYLLALICGPKINKSIFHFILFYFLLYKHQSSFHSFSTYKSFFSVKVQPAIVLLRPFHKPNITVLGHSTAALYTEFNAFWQSRKNELLMSLCLLSLFIFLWSCQQWDSNGGPSNAYYSHYKRCKTIVISFLLHYNIKISH